MNTKQYIKAIHKAAKTLGAEIVEVEKGKHLKVHMKWRNEKRFVMFPSTPSNGNAEKLITKKIKIFFSGSLQHA